MHSTIQRRKTAARAVAVLLAAGTAVSTLAAVPAQARADGTLTDFGYDATAYGSKTKGNENASSDATALSHLPCTRYVPRDRSNHVVTGGDGDGVEVRGATTHNFSRKKNGVASAISTAHIDGGSLADGAVQFRNLNARNRSFHGAKGYAVEQTSNIGSLEVGGTNVPLPAGDQEMTVPVPGQGTLTVNQTGRRANEFSAVGTVNVLKFVGDDGTVERVGHAFSRIDGEIEGGLFRGAAFGSQARVGDGTATSGRAALQPIPCPGTRGKVLENSTGETNPSFGFLGARRSFAFGEQGDNGSATGYTRSVIDEARFGVLKLSNVRARANVTRRAGGDTLRDAKGTGVGKIVVAGERVPTPAAGRSQPFPGGRFTVAIVDRSKRGIDVTGVQVRLFNGTPKNQTDDTVVDLARANLEIRKG